METAKRPTSQSMLLLLLLYGATISTALPNRELQMLEMMQSILGVDSSDFGGRSQRSGPMMFASSVPCDDSLPEDSNDNFNLFESDFADSEECDDCGPPDELEPCLGPMVPMQHPCYVRVIILRTPLMRHDPCKNFTLAMEQATPPPTSTTTTTVATTTTTKLPKRKGKRCKSKKRKGFSSSAVKAQGSRKNINTTSTTQESTPNAVNETTPITNTTAETTSAERTTTNETTSNTASPTSSNTTEDTTTTEEVASTTEETSPTPPTTTTTTTMATVAITLSYTKKNQLKSLRGKRRKKQRRPGVPNKPKIKGDGTMQSSDTHSVFLSAEAAALRSEMESTTDCIESESDEETGTEYDESKTNEDAEYGEESEALEDCEDAEDAENQDTNLCPQFSAPDEPANIRHLPASNRYRKPVKNYVEPILYEGQFAKPRQRIGILPPQRRDYYVSNKQIMPRPRPKFREPVPHSIYMNNIVRGLKCSDEVADLRNYRPQPRRFQTVKPTTSQRIWPSRRHGNGYNPAGTQSSQLSFPRSRVNPSYSLSSAEDPDAYGNDSDQYYDDDDSQELMPWTRDRSPQPLPPPPDPCQAEIISRERERDRSMQGQRERELETLNHLMSKRDRKEREERERERERERVKNNEHIYDYQNQMHRNFFT